MPAGNALFNGAGDGLVGIPPINRIVARLIDGACRCPSLVSTVYADQINGFASGHSIPRDSTHTDMAFFDEAG